MSISPQETSVKFKAPFSFEPGKALSTPIGVASPLWLAFAGAASAGVAFWWMTRWMRPTNLEADVAVVEAAVAEPELTVEIATAPEPEPVIAPEIVAEPEPVVEAAPIVETAPVVEAPAPVVAKAKPAAPPKPIVKATAAPAAKVVAPAKKTASAKSAAKPKSAKTTK